MSLTDHYLYEVGRYLPDAQKSDILAELRSALEDEISEFGPAPNREQIESVLDRRGHPQKVAEAYSEPRYLIGPELFPAFVQTLSTVLTVTIVIVVSLQLLTWVTSGFTTGFWSLFGNVLSLGGWLVAAIVIGFAVLEQYGERLDWYDNWSAATLRDAPPAPVNRSDVMTNLITEGVFLLWWNGALALQNWFPALGSEFTISLSSAWAPLYWPLNIIAGAAFVLHATTLVKRAWTRRALGIELLLCVAALLACVYLIAQPVLLSIDGLVEGSALLERSLRVTLMIIAAIITWDCWQAIRLIRSPATALSD
ncbi:MAG: hypothetical protein AAF465_09255 [Pseudomonadota bacterium]